MAMAPCTPHQSRSGRSAPEEEGWYCLRCGCEYDGPQCENNVPEIIFFLADMEENFSEWRDLSEHGYTNCYTLIVDGKCIDSFLPSNYLGV